MKFRDIGRKMRWKGGEKKGVDVLRVCCSEESVIKCKRKKIRKNQSVLEILI